jgi:DNA-binding XRE family transcriptional regulator
MSTLDSPSSFAAALRERRRALNLSQDDVALAIGVSRKVINELERGKPSVELRIAIDALRAVGLELRTERRGEGNA